MSRKIIWAGGAAIFIAVFAIDRETGLFVGCALNLLFGLALAPEKTWAWAPAVAISWLWVGMAGDLYAGYNTFRVTILGVSLFPILAWPNMLMLLYFWAYPALAGRTWWGAWLRLSLLYSTLLILFEYAGYHFAGIHLDAGRSYRGWPVLDIFHCPWWMQVAYFLNGILFCGIICWGTARFEAARRQVSATPQADLAGCRDTAGDSDPARLTAIEPGSDPARPPAAGRQPALWRRLRLSGPRPPRRRAKD